MGCDVVVIHHFLPSFTYLRGLCKVNFINILFREDSFMTAVREPISVVAYCLRPKSSGVLLTPHICSGVLLTPYFRCEYKYDLIKIIKNDKIGVLRLQS